MKKFTAIVFTALVLGLSGPVCAMAQTPAAPQRHGSRGMDAGSTGMYDPKTVETLRGEVVAVERVTPRGRKMGRMMQGAHQGIHLLVKTGKDTLSVHLGPAWYIDHQALKIVPKDKISIRGSRIMFDGKPALVAAEVRKDDAVLTLRDANGVPAWVSWRRHSPDAR